MVKFKIEEILVMDERRLLNIAIGMLDYYGYEVMMGSDFTIGYREDAQLCFVAHVDKVGGIPQVKKSGIFLYSANGEPLGGDDRAGVWIMFELIRKKSPAMFIFTNGEECGGIGAKEIINTIPQEIFKDISLMIELDRQGSLEYVYYHSIPKEVKKYIESFGFKEDFGTFSDISILSPYYKIPAVNLSVGYSHQHSRYEYLNIPVMKDTLSRCKKMIKKPLPKVEYTPGEDYEWEYYEDIYGLSDDELALLENKNAIAWLYGEPYCIECGEPAFSCSCGNIDNILEEGGYGIHT